MNKDIEDLRDIIKILTDMLIINNVSHEDITLALRKYHYCINCYNHYRQCKCGESTEESSEYDDNYTSSEYNSSE